MKIKNHKVSKVPGIIKASFPIVSGLQIRTFKHPKLYILRTKA